MKKRNLSDLSNPFLGKFKALPEYVQAIQFTNSPENIGEINFISNGKFEINNDRVDAPILHIEVAHLSLTLSFGDWLICKNEEEGKWTSHSHSDFIERYEEAEEKWKKYPENKPENKGQHRVFGLLFKGSDSEVITQFKAYWDGEHFVDKNGEDLTSMDEGITHFYHESIVPDPE